MEEWLGLFDRPFVPLRAGVRPVPNPRKGCDLMQWDRLSKRESMLLAPSGNFGSRVEWEDHGAMRMDIVPGLRWWNRKVDDHILHTSRKPVLNINDYRTEFRTESCMNPYPSLYESRHPQGAPDTRSPPACFFVLDPIDCRSQGKGMDDPRLNRMGMKDNTVDIRESL